MSNANTNARFLATCDADTRAAILTHIARQYGITSEQAHAEVTDADAEHLLDYMTGRERVATSALMQRHGLSQAKPSLA